MLISIIINLIGIGIALGFTQVLVSPLINLTHASEEFLHRDLNSTATVNTQDEIGVLATTFNSMTGRVRDLIGNLEQRVVERTQALEHRAIQLQAAADVGSTAVRIHDLDELLRQVTYLISERFGFYHVGIFLLDEKGEYATLRASNSNGGQRMLTRGHKLRVGQVGIVGYVTGSGQPRIALNVGEDIEFYSNPDLPDTRSEMALPLAVAGKILGALDIQSSQETAFSQEDISTLKVLTDQIAIAIENARSNELAQEAINEMRELDRLKSQFLANISHELRTPLNSIIGFSRVIIKGIDGPVTDLQEQDLSAIYNSGQHLLRLINDILDLSKIDAGRMELAFEDVNRGELLQNVIPIVNGLIKDKPITLASDIEPGIPIVRADAMRLRQVLINLLSNAAKFTDEGIITLSAAVEPRSNGQKEVIIKVSDTGSGIAPEDIKNYFNLSRRWMLRQLARQVAPVSVFQFHVAW